MKTRIQALLPWTIAAGFTVLFATPWCGALFGCGCTWNWAGGVRFCDIHQAMGPHCPWCSHGAFGFDVVAAGSIVLMQALTITWLERRQWNWLALTAAGIATFFPAGTLVAAAFALYDHSPLFLSWLR